MHVQPSKQRLSRVEALYSPLLLLHPRAGDANRNAVDTTARHKRKITTSRDILQLKIGKRRVSSLARLVRV